MKKCISIALVVIVIFSACNESGNKAATENDKYQKAKEILERRERENPVAFLKVTSTDKHNFIGQTVVKGSVRNNANVCTYKDVKLELSFFSKTGTLLLQTNETVYDKIEPGKTIIFKSREFAPKGSDSVSIKVLGAKIN